MRSLSPGSPRVLQLGPLGKNSFQDCCKRVNARLEPQFQKRSATMHGGCGAFVSEAISAGVDRTVIAAGVKYLFSFNKRLIEFNFSDKT